MKRTTSTATAATPASSVRTLDSQAVHLFYHPEAAGASVARLAAEHALAASAQSKSVTMSDWSLAPLAPRQVAYAAEDASLSFRIAQRQFERPRRGRRCTEWAACFLGVDTPLAMDARRRDTKNPETSGVPEAMLAAFRRHHSAMTRLRRLRANASRWRAMTVALAKHAANAPGFTSAVSTLDVVRARRRAAARRRRTKATLPTAALPTRACACGTSTRVSTVSRRLGVSSHRRPRARRRLNCGFPRDGFPERTFGARHPG